MKSLDVEYLYKNSKTKLFVKLGKVKMIITLNFTGHKSNMKMLWSGIHSIINVKSNVGTSISSLNQNGVKVEEPKIMANIINPLLPSLLSPALPHGLHF